MRNGPEVINNIPDQIKNVGVFLKRKGAFAFSFCEMHTYNYKRFASKGHAKVNLSSGNIFPILA